MAYLGDKKISIGIAQVVRAEYPICTYNESASYKEGELVYYNGALYTPIVESVTGVLPTDTASWKPLLKAIEVVRL